MTETESQTARPGRGRRMGRVLLWALPIVVVGVVVAWAVASGGDGEDAEQSARALDFEEVVVTDLTEVTTFGGTLGFDEGDPIGAGLAGTLTATAAEGSLVAEGEILFTVDDQPVPLLYGDTTVWRAMGYLPELDTLTPRLAGTVTRLAPEGSVVEQGDVLMEVNGAPIVVLYGEVPAYRMLRRNVEGDDVAQLQAALQALGYDPDGD
ncbi:MAG: hypothetical protein GWN79_00915, partial [Actinobacteria bacterium]|nr:hypothetical protein [Actinomycetota bacterium]NIS30436.1 hypothetical protein [Actinomycetota bacterium]NIU17737.1 hypothetical protein [Actinomycetota bacterium]NIU65667.1 hypothetical protein [Actinomycetota bacterium]NIV85526.1 hypothetical protein [Actinomycetota bacterium]